MAGDTHYLALLENEREFISSTDYDTEPGSWKELDECWKELEHNPSEWALEGLADAAFALYVAITGNTPDEVIDQARSLHIRKNAGYAGASNPDPWANFRMCEAFGVSAFDGVLVRLSDKYIRTQNLREDPANEQVGESLLDTLADLGAYALIGICIRREKK